MLGLEATYDLIRETDLPEATGPEMAIRYFITSLPPMIPACLGSYFDTRCMARI